MPRPDRPGVEEAAARGAHGGHVSAAIMAAVLEPIVPSKHPKQVLTRGHEMEAPFGEIADCNKAVHINVEGVPCQAFLALPARLTGHRQQSFFN